MGRASRMKAKARAERQPRTVSIYDPSTGLFEEHTTTISPGGIQDWMLNRRRLASEGYPDRVPDIDTSRFRGWISEPVSRSDIEGATVTGPAGGLLILALRVGCPDGTHKVFFEETGEGVLAMTFRCVDAPDSRTTVRIKAGRSVGALVDTLVPDLIKRYRSIGVHAEIIRPEDILAASA